MILLAISDNQMIIVFLLGLLAVVLLGYTILHFAKIKVEKDLDFVSNAAFKNKETTSSPIVKKIESIEDIKEPIREKIEMNIVKEETKAHKKSESEQLSEIEIVLAKMQTDLNKDDSENINSFEEEQEEKSIISYQELKAMKDKIVPYDDELEENSVFALPTVEKMLEIKEQAKDEILIEDVKDDEELKEIIRNPHFEKRDSNFSSSEIISPIYGRMASKKLDYPTIPSFKNEIDIAIDDSNEMLYESMIVDYEEDVPLVPFEKEIVNGVDAKKSQEFLNELKSFRENL